MGYYQCGLHCRAATICRTRFHHGHCRFRHKAAHFVSTVTTISAAGAAHLFLNHVWKHHGLPRRVVSDRGPQFVAEFTWELYWLLGIKLAATTAYYPRGYGQTESVNQELEQYLQLFTNQRQDDWVGFLPFTEFQYNNQVHSSTQHPPFLLDTGRVPAWALNRISLGPTWSLSTSSKIG